MLYIKNKLSQLDYDELVKVANSILISSSLPKSKGGIIKSITAHQESFGDSEVVTASELKPDEFILQPIEARLFQAEVKIAWCKTLRCYPFEATLEDIAAFMEMYNSVFLSNATPLDLVKKISQNMIQIETISTKALGKTSINCQCVVRAAVLPSFKFVRKIGDI
ncbi:hypothetical protein CAL7716_100430 (plasmid) [Calothrix sp. PCC 7716]|nr:hypothetical protein CAL7716_100430 [Calothrix sp. PCC 7716]